MVTAPHGRTYRVQVDVIAEEYVTILENGDLLLEDAVTGEPTLVTREGLDAFANIDSPYSAHLADCIQRDLLSETHDDCEWPWERQPEGGWWYRPGPCPTCGLW